MHRRRITVLFLALAAAFVAVEAWLFSLQVVHGEGYREYAERQRIALLPRNVARARILSSDGKVLAADALAYDVVVVIGKLDPSRERRIRGPLRRLFYVPRGETLLRIRQKPTWHIRRETRADGAERFVAKAASKLEVEVRDADDRPTVELVDREVTFEVPEHLVRSTRELARLTGEPRDELLDRVFDAAAKVARLHTPVFTPVEIVKGVDYEVVAAVDTRPERFRGFRINERYQREMPSGPLCPHVVGYLSKFNEGDVERALERYHGWPGRGYFMTLRAGRAGIERTMDAALRGDFGMRCVERDHRGREQQTLADAPATAGRDVVLTIDSRLQRIVEDALAEVTGAAVFIDCRTGHILAMASSPGYDPARFRQDYRTLAADPDHPFINRAIRGFPLGSVFKIVTALAALENRRVPTGVTCEGSLRYGRRRFRCHRRYGHGRMDLTEAIKHSCNVFFYHTARKVGEHRLLDMACRLGFGRATGVRLPGESPGNLPQRAPGGELLNISIGQGRLLVTPLQTAQLLAVVANDGVLMPARLLRELRPFDTPGAAAAEAPDDGRKPVRVGLSRRSLDAVRLGLYKVVNEYGGTGYKVFRQFERPFKVCGKTSTAQRTLRGARDNVGWFAGFAPYKEPRIAFAIAVEHLTGNEGGGGTAGPIARAVLDAIPLDLLGVKE